jgi:hypothetical protein
MTSRQKCLRAQKEKPMESDVQATLDTRKPRFASVDNSGKNGAHIWAPTMAPIPDPTQVTVTSGLMGLTIRDAADRALPSADAGANPACPYLMERHMELDTAISQGADAGATPVGSYNFTESGIKRAALSTKSGNVPVQPPLSPMVPV